MKTISILCALLGALSACSSPPDTIHNPASMPAVTFEPSGPDAASRPASRAIQPRRAPMILNPPRAGTPTCVRYWDIDPANSELVLASCDERLYRWTLGVDPRYAGHVALGNRLGYFDISADGTGFIGHRDYDGMRQLHGWRLGAERAAWVAQRVRDTSGRPVIIGNTATISPDGKLAAATGSDAVLRLWDAATGEPLATYPGVNGQVAFTADSRWLAVSGGVLKVGHSNITPYAARLIDVRTQTTHPLPLKGRELVAVSPDGGRMVLAKDGTRADDHWYVLDTNTLSSVKHAPIRHLHHFEYSADGSLFLAVSSASSGFVSLYDAATMKRLGKIEAGRCEIGMARFTPDSARVVVSTTTDRQSRCTGQFEIFDARTRKRLVRFNPLRQRRAVSALAFSNNSRYLATGSSKEGLAIWDVTRRARIATVDRPDLTVSSIQFSADDRRILYPDGAGVVSTYDLTADATDSYLVGNKLRQLRDAAWGRDDRYIWGCDAEAVYRREAAQTRDEAHLAEQLWHVDWACESVRFLDWDRSTLLITPDREGRGYVVLDVNTMEWHAPKQPSDKSVIRSLTVSPSQRYRVRRVESGAVEMIDKDDAPVAQLVAAASAGATVEPHFWFSVDERVLFGRVDDQLFRWDAPFERAQPRAVASLSGGTVFAVSPDGRTLAIGRLNGSVELHAIAVGR